MKAEIIHFPNILHLDGSSSFSKFQEKNEYKTLKRKDTGRQEKK